MAQAISRDLLKQFSDEVLEYDAKLDEGSGSKASGKRAIKNRLADSTPVDISGLIGFFKNLPTPEVRAGAWVKFEKAFSESLEKEIDAFIDSQITPADTVTISPEEMTRLEAERKAVAAKFFALADLWKMVNEDDDISDIPVPKKRTGARGPRGPRAISSYQWAINGVDLSAKENSLTHIASLVPNWKAKDLRAHVVAQLSTENEKGEKTVFNFKNPPETFSFTLPTGQTVSGTKMVAAEDPDEDDDDDEADAPESD